MRLVKNFFFSLKVIERRKRNGVWFLTKIPSFENKNPFEKLIKTYFTSSNHLR